jgi:hypothetical protein
MNVNGNRSRRLAAIEIRAAALPPRPIPPAISVWLSTLSDEQLEAVETFADMLHFGPPAALKPAESLSDEEAVEEWRRLIALSEEPSL